MEWGRNLLEKVRSLDESAKQKILIGSSIVVMIVVIFIWAEYFNSIVIPSTAETGAATSTVAGGAATSSSSTDFWHTIGNDILGMGNILNGGNQEIQPATSTQ